MRQHCATQMVVLYLETSGVGAECLPAREYEQIEGYNHYGLFFSQTVYGLGIMLQKKKKKRHTLNVGHAAMTCGGHHICQGPERV